MSLKTSCIIHPKSHPFVRIMRWQIEACDGNKCAAALLSMFEAWHNWKIEQAIKAGKLNNISEFHGLERSQDESFYQWHTEEDLVKSILGLFGRVTINKAITLLVEKKFISVHRNPDTRAKFDRTRFFLFEVAAVQIWINAAYPSTIALAEPSANNGGWSANNGGWSANNGGWSANNGARAANNGATSAKSSAPNANSGGSYKESTETNQGNRPKKHQQQAAEAENVVVDSNSSFVEESDPISQTNLLREMDAIGVSPKVVNEFIADAEITPEMIRLQLDCLSDREPNDAAATFVSAVRGNWSPPGDYHKRLEASDAAKIARAATEQRAAAESRANAAQDAANAAAAALYARLDAKWEQLDDDERALVEKTALKEDEGNDFVADRLRRDGELPIMIRRAAIEILVNNGMLDLDDEFETDAAAPAPQIAPEPTPRPTAATPSPLAAHPADLLFEFLPPEGKKSVEATVKERLDGMPETEQTADARITLRRALIVDFMARAVNETTGNAPPQMTGDEQSKTA